MEVLKNLTGKTVEDIDQVLEILPVKVGDYAVADKRGVIIKRNDKVRGVTILDSNYVLLTHKELRETFLNELTKHYNGKIEEVEDIRRSGKQYVGKFMLLDYKVDFDSIYEKTNGRPPKDSIAPIITIKNSYDRTMAVSVEWGVYRFTCRNIMDRIWSGSEVVRYQHNQRLLEIGFDMGMIIEISRLITQNVPELNRIEVDGLKAIYQLSEMLDEPLLYQWEKNVRAKRVREIKTLWHLINELTYITTHKPKMKVKTGSGIVVHKSVIPPKKFNKVYAYILDQLKHHLDPMYRQISDLLSGLERRREEVVGA